VVQAQALAVRLEAAPDATKAAWQLIFGRQPSDFEAERTKQFLEKQTATVGSRKAALTELARGLFNVNEFLYVE
jgi:hypothetical protein